MTEVDKKFSTMNGGTFYVMLNNLIQRNPGLAFADVVFEDEKGCYHPIKKIVIDQKMALAMIALKEKEGD